MRDGPKGKERLRQAQPSRWWVVLFLLIATPVAARGSLGLYSGWAAFRDARPARCFAIAEPARRATKDARWRPFASVAVWPGARTPQLHIRLRRPATGRITLQVGGRRFPLLAGGADAWAPDAETDAAIIAAMRGADSLSVGGDSYALRGAATAIDAAALGCVRR